MKLKKSPMQLLSRVLGQDYFLLSQVLPSSTAQIRNKREEKVADYFLKMTEGMEDLMSNSKIKTSFGQLAHHLVSNVLVCGVSLVASCTISRDSTTDSKQDPQCFQRTSKHTQAEPS
jgi:hypothetical protein